MIFGDFIKAINQLGDPAFRRVFWRGVGLTFAFLAAMALAFRWVMGQLVQLEFVASVVGEAAWLGSALGITSLFVMLGLSVFLMVPVASAITSFFLDEVAEAVEARHHPHLPPAEGVGWGEALVDTVQFLGLLLVANLAALILYLTLPFGAPLIFVMLNGYLLGREYFYVAAMRRIGRAGAREMRSQHWAEIWVAGALMAAPLTIPIVNLLIPILGAATFTHMFHRLQARG